MATFQRQFEALVVAPATNSRPRPGRPYTPLSCAEITWHSAAQKFPNSSLDFSSAPPSADAVDPGFPAISGGRLAWTAPRAARARWPASPMTPWWTSSPASLPSPSAGSSACPRPGATSSTTPTTGRSSPKPCKDDKISESDGSKFSVDCFSFVDLTARSVPPFIDPCFSFLTELPGIQFLVLLDSCNGLILFANRRYRDHESETLGYSVCNPSTQPQSNGKTCPPVTIHLHRQLSPIWLSIWRVSPDFSLVQFEVDGDMDEEEFMSVRAYSSEMGTWSHNLIDELGEEEELEGWRYEVRPSFDHLGCTFVNGILHFVVWHWDQREQLIFVVDVQGKARKMITVPGANAMHPYVCYVGQSEGRLHCVTQETINIHDKSEKLCIWVLQDYDKQEWVLKDSLSSLQLFVDKSCRDKMDDIEVVDIHQDCNVVFFALSLKNKLIAYDMGRNS